MATKDGSTVKQGVDWEVDDKTLTVKMYPGGCNAKGIKYELQPAKTWRNECPHCKKKAAPNAKKRTKTQKATKYEGVLYAHGTKGSKKAPEGEITCRQCGADYDGVSGGDKYPRCNIKLISASSSSATALSAEKAVLSKKEALFKLKEEYKERRSVSSKRTITIPIIPGLKKGDYIRLDPPLGNKKKYYIGSVQINNDSMALEIHDKFPEPPTKYTEKYEEKK